MLELLHLIYIDIKRALVSKYFYGSIIGICLILFGSSIPYLFYMQVDVIFILNKLIRNATIVHLIFYLAMLSHTFSMKEDIRSCYIQYILIRTKAKYYCLSKVISCVVIGAIVIFIASVLFIMLLSVKIPFISVTGTSYEFFYNHSIFDSKGKEVYAVFYIVSKMGNILLWGIFLVVIGLVCHSYFKYGSTILASLFLTGIGISNYFESVNDWMKIINESLLRELWNMVVLYLLSTLLINVIINKVRKIREIK